MKNIFIILIFLFAIQQAHTQSFMDQMKKERAQSSTPAQQKTNTSSTYQSSSQYNAPQRNTTSSTSQDSYQIKNRWKGTFLQNQYGKVVDGQQNNNAEWVMEPVVGISSTINAKVFKLRNKVDGTYLIEENGSLSSQKSPSSNSLNAQWQSIIVRGTNFVQIKNRASGKYIHNEYGSLTISALGKPGWHSAQWQLTPIDANPTAGAYSSTATKKSTKGFYPNSTTMYFRYTDQVQGGNSLQLKVGDRIKVLPNQSVPASFLEKKLDVYDGKPYYGKTGLSFDPNSPKICGKTFTVASVNPLKFTEEFPENMRNSFNSSFAFKVVKL